MLPLIYKSQLNLPAHQTTRKFMQPGEQDVLLALIDSVQPYTMVEIGVQVGITARAVLQFIPDIERYVGIDVDEHYQFEIPSQASERPDVPGELVKHDPRFRLCIRGHDKLPETADVVFIDGDHGRAAVRRDSIWAASVISHGGLIIWHDYDNVAQVTEVLEDLRAEGRDIRRISGTWLAFELG